MLFITKGNLSQPKKGVYNEKNSSTSDSDAKNDSYDFSAIKKESKNSLKK